MAPIVDKIMENGLSWLRDVLKREETEAIRVVKIIYIERNKEKGRPKNM